ncbi:hypothetical protein Tco_0780885 [Tanacetum coccineum]
MRYMSRFRYQVLPSVVYVPSTDYELSRVGSLEDIPSSNTTKIKYLYTKENNIQEKIKIKLKSANGLNPVGAHPVKENFVFRKVTKDDASCWRGEEEDPQEEDDIEVDIEEDENEPELTYPYEDVDPLNPPPPASESEPEDAIEDSDGLLPGLMRRTLTLFLVGWLLFQDDLRSSVKQGTTTMAKLVEKLGNAKDKVECKKLKKELEEARFSNTFLRMQNKRVKRDLYWTRVQAREFYQEMIRRGFVFEERPNEVINVLIEDEKSPSFEP